MQFPIVPNRHRNHPKGIRFCRDLFEVVAALLTPQVCYCEKATFFASFFFARKERRDIKAKLSK